MDEKIKDLLKMVGIFVGMFGLVIFAIWASKFAASL